MNNLHAARPDLRRRMAQIEEEATRTLKRYLAGARVVYLQGRAASCLRRRHGPSAQPSRRRPPASSPPAESSRWSSCACPSSSIASDRRRRAWRQ